MGGQVFPIGGLFHITIQRGEINPTADESCTAAVSKDVALRGEMQSTCPARPGLASALDEGSPDATRAAAVELGGGWDGVK